jgi:hypothetical protein
MSSNTKDNWYHNKWRPSMGWVYMITCITDFILFPIGWTLLQTFTGAELSQWNPITLQSGSFYHIAMGAIVGVTAYGRTQEKIKRFKSP